MSFEQRVLTRAYYIWLNTGNSDSLANYYHALHIELNQSSDVMDYWEPDLLYNKSSSPSPVSSSSPSPPESPPWNLRKRNIWQNYFH